ncbi:DAK2 domain-containing protein [Nocardia sp. NPDC004068]|uniref:DAK2 domain-containing protein n=1 Tax=Nocardia sp. NPDC004068 TaxID=3364303 RepID=UPI0036A4DF73
MTVPGVREVLDGAALARWGRLCLDGLERHREEINALNVFPVADSDTGTNLLTTMRAAVEAVAATDSAHAVAAAMSRAGTLGARGNSGIILSQVLRGLAEAVVDGPLTARTFPVALRRAAVLVRESLSAPVDGTMLTVLEAAAARVAESSGESLADLASAAAEGVAKAVRETTSQLGVLREAGVVDAGARGLLVLFDAWVEVITGQSPSRPPYLKDNTAGSISEPASSPSVPASPSVPPSSSPAPSSPSSVPATSWSVPGTSPSVPGSPSSVPGSSSSVLGSSPSVPGSPPPVPTTSPRVPATSPLVPAEGRDLLATIGTAEVSDLVRPAPAIPQYEVMYVISETDDERIAELRKSLAALGDSVVVVGDGGGAFSAHVHCADAGAAVEAGLATGALSKIRIEGLAVNPLAVQGSGERGILAVVRGAGAARLFEDAGATVLDGEVTAEVLLAAIRALPHREVLVLPNGALPAHELVAVSVAARDGRREVLMLPSGSMVQGLAALALHDAGRIAVDDAFTMSEAAAGTRWGALRIATERALTIVGTCGEGDGLGLVGHDVVVIDPDLRAAARTLLDRMLGLGGELVTLLLGADAPAGLADELAEHISATFPGVEVVSYDGGQPVDLVQIGVE